MDEDKTLEISGQTIAIGTPVNVMWLDKWYEGKVVELGYNYLYKVKDTGSGLSILLEKDQIKVIDKTRPTHEQYSQGAEIAYYDNGLCTWLSAIIEDGNTQESVLVKWQRENSSNPNINWFEMTNIAPIISNEAYGIEFKIEEEEREEDETQMTSKSKLQLPSMTKVATLEEVLEERPRHRKNSMFQDVGNTIESPQRPFENRLATFTEEHDSSRHVKSHRTSVSMKHFYSDNFDNKLSQHNDAKLDKYVQMQKALLHGTLDHSALPPVFSYFSQHKGIPHHPSSRFFRHHKTTSDLARSSGQYYGSQGWVRPFSQSSVKRTMSEHFNQSLSRSTTMNTDPPHSDVSPYAQVFFSQGKNRHMKRYRTDMSSRPLPALPNEKSMSPYEVPLPLSSPASWSNLQPQQKARPNMYYTPQLEKFDEVISPNEVNAPTIVSSSKNEIMVSAGGTITLFCEAKSDAPITYEWIKNGQKLSNNDDRVAFPSPGHLQLYGLCIADAGTYQCQVSNEGGMAIYKCEIYVEEESLKKSFSREYGLDKLAKDLPLPDDFNQQKRREKDDTSLTSISLDDEPDDDFHSQAPAYDDYPLSMVRHTLSLASLNASINPQDQTKIILGGTEEDKEKKKKKKKKELSERKTKKDKRRRVSNVLMDNDDYLGGYGQDYGEMTDEKILASAIIAPTGDKRKQLKMQKKAEKKDKKRKKNNKTDNHEEVTSMMGQKNVSFVEEEASIIPVDTNSIQQENTSSIKQEEASIQQEDTNSIKQEEASIQQEDTNSIKQEVDDTVVAPNNSSKTYPVISIEAEVTLEYEEGMIREEGEGAEESTDNIKQQTPIINNIKHKDIAKSQDSIDAHPSYTSLLDEDEDEDEERNEFGSQEREAGEGREENNEDHLYLPQETQHYTEGVKRLQEANEEYEKEHGFGGMDDEEKKRKRSGLSKLFNKSSSKLDDDNKLTMI